MSGYGLMQMSNSIKSNAMGGLRDAASLEENRNNVNSQLKQAKRSSEMTSAATGAAIGFMDGGPIGAGIGLLGGYLLS